MNEEKYDAFLLDYKNELLRLNYRNFALYRPLTSAYWDSRPRILWCNLEPYKLRKSGVFEVDFQFLEHNEWTYANTISNTALFLNVIKHNVERERCLSAEQIRGLRESTKDNFEVLKSISYLNFRVTSNKSVLEGTSGILNQVKRLAGHLKRQIEVLNPNIIIVGGRTGCKAFESIFERELAFGGSTEINGMKVHSVPHPSRLSYKRVAKKAAIIAKEIRNLTFSST